MPKKFYVYELREPDGMPFYVGKGKGGRIREHSGRARRGFKGYVYNKIRSLWEEGKNYSGHKIFETDSEEEAFAEEKRVIASYKASGIGLCNLTDGGEGAAGMVLTQEQRDAVSKRNTGLRYKRPEEFKRQKRETMKGNTNGRGKRGAHYHLSEEGARRVREAAKARIGKVHWSAERHAKQDGRPWNEKRRTAEIKRKQNKCNTTATQQLSLNLGNCPREN